MVSVRILVERCVVNEPRSLRYSLNELTIPQIPDGLFLSTAFLFITEGEKEFEARLHKYFSKEMTKSELELLLQVAFDEYQKTKTLPKDIFIAYNCIPEFEDKRFIVYKNRLLVASNGKIEKEFDLAKAKKDEIALDGIKIDLLFMAKSEWIQDFIVIRSDADIQKLGPVLVVKGAFDYGIYDTTKNEMLKAVVDFMRERYLETHKEELKDHPLEKAKLFTNVITFHEKHSSKPAYTLFTRLSDIDDTRCLAFGKGNICCITKISSKSMLDKAFSMLAKMQDFDIDDTYSYFFDRGKIQKIPVKHAVSDWYCEKFIRHKAINAIFVDEKNGLISCKLGKNKKGRLIVKEDKAYVFNEDCTYILSRKGLSKTHVLDIKDLEFMQV